MDDENLDEVLNKIQENEVLELKIKGNEAFKNGKYEKALIYYNKALENDPRNTDVLHNKGLTFAKMGRIEDAKHCKEILKSISESNKSNPPKQTKLKTPKYFHYFLIILIGIGVFIAISIGVAYFVFGFHGQVSSLSDSELSSLSSGFLPSITKTPTSTNNIDTNGNTQLTNQQNDEQLNSLINKALADIFPTLQDLENNVNSSNYQGIKNAGLKMTSISDSYYNQIHSLQVSASSTPLKSDFLSFLTHISDVGVAYYDYANAVESKDSVRVDNARNTIDYDKYWIEYYGKKIASEVPSSSGNPRDSVSSNSGPTQYVTPNPTSVVTFAPISTGIVVRIIYSGHWQGALGDEGGVSSVDGTGSKNFQIPGDPYIVSANAQKMDDSSNTLTIQIIKNGNLIKQGTTKAAYGVAQISTSF